MKMLFCASDRTRLENVSRRLLSAGVPCEIRQESGQDSSGVPFYPELWVRSGAEFKFALLVSMHDIGQPS